MPSADKAEIMESLTGIFREVFDDPALVLRDQTTAADVENWDSLNHIDLIVAVERKFKVRFTTREVTSLNTVGDLAELIANKLGATR